MSTIYEKFQQRWEQFMKSSKGDESNLWKVLTKMSAVMRCSDWDEYNLNEIFQKRWVQFKRSSTYY